MNLAVIGKIGSASCVIGFGIGGSVGGIARAIVNSTSESGDEDPSAKDKPDIAPKPENKISDKKDPKTPTVEALPDVKEDLNIYIYAISKPKANSSASSTDTTINNQTEFQCQINSKAQFDCTVSKLKVNGTKQHNMKDIKLEETTTYGDLSIANNSFQIKFLKENDSKTIQDIIQLPAKIKIIPKSTAGTFVSTNNASLTPDFVMHKKQPQQGNMYLISKPLSDASIKITSGKKFYCSFEDKKDVKSQCDIKLFSNDSGDAKKYSELVFNKDNLTTPSTIEKSKYYLIELDSGEDSTTNSDKTKLSSEVVGKTLYVDYRSTATPGTGDQKITFNNLVKAFKPGDYDHIFVL